MAELKKESKGFLGIDLEKAIIYDGGTWNQGNRYKRKAPDFCEGKEYPYTVSGGIPMPDYWVVLKDFTYNKKSDRYVCSTSYMQTQEYVADTKLKKGDLLKRNFRYENAIQNMVADGVIMEASKYKSSSLGFGDPLKNKKWLVYGLIAVAGYFIYNKLKK